MEKEGNNNIQWLVSPVLKKIKDLDKLHKENTNFNIFYSTGIWNKEVYICNLLCDLLSPQGTHKSGDLFLRLFNERVLKKVISEDEFGCIEVIREEPTEEKRRIDLLIKTNKRFIPIEVKIFAGDQEKQCVAYYEEIERRNKKMNLSEKVVLYYLTPDGHQPSAYSIGNLKEGEQYKTISFKTDIKKWLKDCLKKEEIERCRSIKYVLEQFIAVIDEWGIPMECQKTFEEIEKLNVNERNTAILIWRTIEYKKDMLWGAFIEMFEKFFFNKNKLQVRHKDKKYAEYLYYNKDNVKITFIMYRSEKGTYAGFRAYIDDKIVDDEKSDGKWGEYLPQIGKLKPSEEHPWIHMVEFPPFGEENSKANKIDLHGFTGRTMELLFKDKLAYFNEYFVPFVVELTGWEAEKK